MSPLARNLHKLVLYEPAPGFSSVSSEVLGRIEELVARDEREEAVVYAFRALAREGTKRIRAVLPDARVAILRGQGHAATMTAPELVADEIARFLAE